MMEEQQLLVKNIVGLVPGAKKYYFKGEILALFALADYPLGPEHKEARAMKVSLRDNDSPVEGVRDIFVYFVGSFAENVKQLNLSKGDKLVLHRFLIEPTEPTSPLMPPFCLIVCPDLDSSVSVLSSKGSFRITSTSSTRTDLIESPSPSVPRPLTNPPVTNFDASSIKTSAHHPTKKFKETPEYIYDTLSTVLGKSRGEVVNVMAVVVELSAPRPSRGTDYVLSMVVKDPSLDMSVRGVSCMVFRPREDALPRVKKTGDIIRFHRVKVESFQGTRQLISSHATSYLCLDGSPASPLTPYWATSHNVTLSEEDKQQARDLRIWSTSRGEEGGHPTILLTLNQTSPQGPFDLLCQVTDITMTNQGATITVLDGTLPSLYCNTDPGNPYAAYISLPTAHSVALFDGMHPPLLVRLGGVLITKSSQGYTTALGEASDIVPLQDLVVSNPSVATLSSRLASLSSSLSRPVLQHQPPQTNNICSSSSTSTFSSSSTFSMSNALTLPPARPMTFRAPNPPEKTTPSSRNTSEPSAPALPNAEHLLAADDELSSRPLPSTLKTLLECPPSAPVSSLRQLIDANVPAKARCRVRILSLEPRSVSSLARWVCPSCMQTLLLSSFSSTSDHQLPPSCPMCSSSPPLDCSFLFRLQISDTTGQISVLVSGPEAVKLLGIEPIALNEKATVSSLRETFNALLAPKEELFECCLRSYHNIENQRVEYALFGTALNHSSMSK